MSLIGSKRVMAIVALAFWIAAGLVEGPAAAKTVYVSSAGNNTSNGLTWATAKQTVQAGLSTAASGDQVWVAAGTYLENITLKAGVALYGGFAGNETDLSQRNWVANKAILDGSQAGSVVTSPSGATVATRIDGFTIRNGKGTGSGSFRHGGGIYCELSSPTIANNTLTGNVGSYGAGVYWYSSSSPSISNNVVAFNSSGLYGSGGTPTLSSNCVFGNTAYNYSGIADPTGADGNISADPLFVRLPSPGPDGQWATADDDYGDLRLSPGSPCIDAGDNAALPADTLDLDGDGNITEPIPFDLAGHARFVDNPASPDCPWAPGTCGTAPIIDMGAYEFVLEASADLDGDGDVDADDFDQFLAAFGHRSGEQGYNMLADLDNDWAVTFVDYQQWLAAYRAGSGNPQAPAPLQVLGDFGLDGHVDATDLEHLQACTTGPGVPQTDEACRDADLDGDGDIDQADFGSLQRCLSGPDEMVDLSCKY